jgi:molybdopterin-guanine dinucleotide biosynthesis protein A
MAWPVVGVFVGGQGRRMGGIAKGLLVFEGVTLIERVLGACRAAADPGALQHVYLVGNAVPYVATGLPSLDDAPAGLGPIGGLRALLLQARLLGVDALAVAVDLPYLGERLVRRLCLEQPGVAALAPRQAGRWQPLFARYQPDAVLPALETALAAGQTALQSIFRGLEPGPAFPVGDNRERTPRASELVLTPGEERELLDWDSPDDMSTAVRTW